MKRAAAIIGLGAMAFGVALAIYVGSHLSNDAMMLLAGAACGIGAMLPATLLAIFALRRPRGHDNGSNGQGVQQGQPMYPPVIVVSPPQQGPAQSPSPYNMGAPPISAPRRFTVIGDDPIDEE